MRVNHLQYIFNFVEYDSLICQKTEQKVFDITWHNSFKIWHNTTVDIISIFYFSQLETACTDENMSEKNRLTSLHKITQIIFKHHLISAFNTLTGITGSI